METIHIPLKQAVILTKAVCMWERFNNKDGDRAKKNTFNLNKENLIMLKELFDVTSELRVNCKCHHRQWYTLDLRFLMTFVQEIIVISLESSINYSFRSFVKTYSYFFLLINLFFSKRIKALVRERNIAPQRKTTQEILVQKMTKEWKQIIKA